MGVDSASKLIAGGGLMEIDRLSRSTTFHLPSPLPTSVLVHPLLATSAAVVAHWERRFAFHAGAFVADSQAWAICGDKGAGKSSLLAALATIGTPVLSDDAVIVRDRTCLAGPRAVDLRGGAADLFDNPEFLGEIGGRERWRVRLGSAPSEVRLAGWVTLAWGPSSVTGVSPVERGALLIENLGIRAAPADLGGLLDLAALPMLRFTRPRALDGLFASAEALLEAVKQDWASSPEVDPLLPARRPQRQQSSAG